MHTAGHVAYRHANPPPDPTRPPHAHHPPHPPTPPTRPKETPPASPASHPHPPPAPLRGPDPGRIDDKPLLPVDAGVDHATMRAARLRPAHQFPTDAQRLARRLSGQPPLGRHHPARLWRLSALSRQA